jgi:hypothetical protein
MSRFHQKNCVKCKKRAYGAASAGGMGLMSVAKPMIQNVFTGKLLYPIYNNTEDEAYCIQFAK